LTLKQFGVVFRCEVNRFHDQLKEIHIRDEAMKQAVWSLMCVVTFAGTVSAQDFIGSGSVGSSEPLFSYSDQENWKHGYLQAMPYYGGFHAFRPYNYHHVFNQSQTASGWGMSPVMPYSQQFWHKYEHMADMSRGNHTLVSPQQAPVQNNSHFPQQISPMPTPAGMPLMPTPNGSPVPYQGGATMSPQPQYQPLPQIQPQSFQQPGYQQAVAPVQYQQSFGTPNPALQQYLNQGY